MLKFGRKGIIWEKVIDTDNVGLRREPSLVKRLASALGAYIIDSTMRVFADAYNTLTIAQARLRNHR